MLRVGTVTFGIEVGQHLGRAHTLRDDRLVARRHVWWKRVVPSYAEGVVLCRNGVVHRPHNETRWRLVRAGEAFTLRDGGQVCLRRRQRGGWGGRPLLRNDLDLLCLFTFVGDYDSDETIAE